jgi:hypothetical protein
MRLFVVEVVGWADVSAAKVKAALRARSPKTGGGLVALSTLDVFGGSEF